MANRRALFVFKTHTRCEGFIIRKQHWISICEDYDKVSSTYRRICKDDYHRNIFLKINRVKQNLIRQLEQRADYTDIQVNKVVNKGTSNYFDDEGSGADE